jgi:hypothetical protein
MRFPGFDREEQIRDPIKANFAKKNQGQESNIAGKLCEKAIEDAFKARGIYVVSWKIMRLAAGDLFEQRLLIKRVPFISLYGAKSHTEFVYQHPGGLRVRIECKRQETKGSVDEKFPYMMENAKHHMPEPNIWFVIEGIGARAKAITWMKNAAKATEKTIRVFNVSEAQRAIKALTEDGRA